MLVPAAPPIQQQSIALLACYCTRPSSRIVLFTNQTADREYQQTTSEWSICLLAGNKSDERKFKLSSLTVRLKFLHLNHRFTEHFCLFSTNVELVTATVPEKVC